MVNSTRIRVGRNFADFPLGPGVTKEQRLEIMNNFDHIIESKELGIRKPDLDFYLKALEITGADPKETIFLDDLGINLKPARELGMATIKVLDSNQALRELADLTGINFE